MESPILKNRKVLQQTARGERIQWLTLREPIRRAFCLQKHYAQPNIEATNSKRTLGRTSIVVNSTHQSSLKGAVSPQSADRAAKRGSAVISSSYFHRLQRRHFLAFDVLPLVGTIAAMASLAIRPVTVIDLVLFGTLWLLTGLGLTTGFHRLFSHAAFSTKPSIAASFVILGSMAARGSMISWVTIHRRHHQFADRQGDAHSPRLAGETWPQRLRGWLHAHEGWLLKHDYPNPAVYAPDLLRRPVLVKVSRFYYHWVALGLILPLVIGGVCSGSFMGAVTGFLWGGLVRLFVVGQSMSAINSFLHLGGSRPFNTKDDSRNAGMFGLPLWGEAWHNNHHAFPYSAAFGLAWHQFDPGFWLIRILQTVGLAWNVKVARRADIERYLGSERLAE